MIDDKTIGQFSHRFSNPAESSYFLASIASMAAEIGLTDTQTLMQLEGICKIAIPYKTDELAVLKVIDNRYGEAVDEPKSRLYQYRDGKIKDPIVRLRERVDDYMRVYGHKMEIRGIDNVAEDTLLAFKEPDARKVVHSKRGRDKFGS